jgi:hypothetical protein
MPVPLGNRKTALSPALKRYLWLTATALFIRGWAINSLRKDEYVWVASHLPTDKVIAASPAPRLGALSSPKISRGKGLLSKFEVMQTGDCALGLIRLQCPNDWRSVSVGFAICAAIETVSAACRSVAQKLPARNKEIKICPPSFGMWRIRFITFCLFTNLFRL